MEADRFRVAYSRISGLGFETLKKTQAYIIKAENFPDQKRQGHNGKPIA